MLLLDLLARACVTSTERRVYFLDCCRVLIRSTTESATLPEFSLLRQTETAHLWSNRLLLVLTISRSPLDTVESRLAITLISVVKSHTQIDSSLGGLSLCDRVATGFHSQIVIQICRQHDCLADSVLAATVRSWSVSDMSAPSLWNRVDRGCELGHKKNRKP
jgi:hypothetical protein